MGRRVLGFGFRVLGLGFRVYSCSFGFWVWGLGLIRVLGFGFPVLIVLLIGTRSVLGLGLLKGGVVVSSPCYGRLDLGRA